MKIHVFMLTRDRSVKTLKVSDSKRNFIWRRGMYALPVGAVNLARSKTELEPKPELVYVEGNPIPHTHKPQDATVLGEFLDDVLVKNAIEQTASAPWAGFIVFADLMKSPGKLLFLAFVLLVISSLGYQLVIGF